MLKTLLSSALNPGWVEGELSYKRPENKTSSHQQYLHHIDHSPQHIPPFSHAPRSDHAVLGEHVLPGLPLLPRDALHLQAQ